MPNHRVIYLVLFMASRCLAEGGMTSSGGEVIRAEHNPWFIGQKSVNYCIEKSNDFSASVEDSRSVIQEVISNWKFTLSQLKPQFTGRWFPDGETKSLTLEFNEVPCAAQPELIFELGTDHSSIRDILAHESRYTVGLATIRNIDKESGRIHGFIWLAPDSGPLAYLGPKNEKSFWLRRENLFNSLLHEMGHVFGIEHQVHGFMNTEFPGQTIQFNLGYANANEFIFRSAYNQNTVLCAQLKSDHAISQIVFKLDETDSLARLCFAPRENGLIEASVEHTSIKGEEVVYRSNFSLKTDYRNALRSRGYYEPYFMGPTVPPVFFYADFIEIPEWEYRGFFKIDGADIQLRASVVVGLGLKMSAVLDQQFYDLVISDLNFK